MINPLHLRLDQDALLILCSGLRLGSPNFLPYPFVPVRTMRVSHSADLLGGICCHSPSGGLPDVIDYEQLDQSLLHDR